MPRVPTWPLAWSCASSRKWTLLLLLLLLLLRRRLLQTTAVNTKVELKLIPHHLQYFFVQWKEAALRGQQVQPADALVRNLRDLARRHPEFQYNCRTVCDAVDVMLQQQPPELACLGAELLLKSSQQQAPDAGNLILPTVAGSRCPAWAQSGRPEAAAKIAEPE